MSPEQNKAVTRRYLEELWTQNNLAVIDQIIAPDVVGHVAGQTFRGADALRQRANNLRAIYSDVRFIVEDQIAEGDKVAQRVTGRGTLKGEFMGMQPTGRTAVWQEMHWHRFNADGLLVEHWDITDSLGMLTQLAPQSDPG